MKHFFIDALGGNSTVFAFLKLEDIRAMPGVPGLGGTINTSNSEVLKAAEYLGVNFDNLIVQLNGSTVRPNCSNYPKRLETLPRNATFDEIMSSLGMLDSLVGQLHGRVRCAELIKAHEARHAMRFDWVVTMRPDLTWPFPVPPFCYYNVSRPRRRFLDNVWLYDRQWLDQHTLNLYELLFNCSAPFRLGEYVEFWTFDRLAQLGVPQSLEYEYWSSVGTRLAGADYPDWWCSDTRWSPNRLEALPTDPNSQLVCAKVAPGNPCNKDWQAAQPAELNCHEAPVADVLCSAWLAPNVSLCFYGDVADFTETVRASWQQGFVESFGGRVHVSGLLFFERKAQRGSFDPFDQRNFTFQKKPKNTSCWWDARRYCAGVLQRQPSSYALFARADMLWTAQSPPFCYLNLSIARSSTPGLVAMEASQLSAFLLQPLCDLPPPADFPPWRVYAEPSACRPLVRAPLTDPNPGNASFCASLLTRSPQKYS